jgi:8-oxo-dGTP pyrophosphatase MutT (NUDIX family)
VILDDVLPLLHARLNNITHPPAKPTYSDYDLSNERPREVVLRQAGVLVPLMARPNGLTVLLTRRSLHLPTHPGQIAFPGGRWEVGDRDIGATALREAQEEVGLDPAHVTLIGVSDTYETGTGFSVTPVIGLVDLQARLTPDPREVAEIFEVPLAFLMDPANHQPHSRELGGVVRHYYAMTYGDYHVWGATAGMLRALYLRVFG